MAEPTNAVSTISSTNPGPQAPAAAEPTNPAPAPAGATQTPAAPVASDPKPGDPAAGFKSEESKTAVLADLAKERDARQALEARLDAQNKAFAAALGVTETPKNEDLAETVKNLQEQIAKDRHDAHVERVAAANGIDEEHKVLLTETDPEKLKAQAAMVGALVAAKNAAAGTPAFQANPGQGQGGTPPTPEAVAAAEYEKYYPTPK